MSTNKGGNFFYCCDWFCYKNNNIHVTVNWEIFFFCKDSLLTTEEDQRGGKKNLSLFLSLSLSMEDHTEVKSNLIGFGLFFRV